MPIRAYRPCRVAGESGWVDHQTSMLRDIENGSPIEADQIIGDMMRRASSFSLPAPILSTVHAHLKSYEFRGSQRIAA
ncbi:ketopantoate reductase C-terminal domain-containing protein [Mesorhizobium sp.]|uniref:ketopantoate reductase C-terminal domain-containing protein n=2 Tax=Mesorhizobium sp. TaxID=1871066 RepID=UPI0025B9320B|nr:ketopantoate reductase C-terminal domain-containing protein [Mesorhizobium sp.]